MSATIIGGGDSTPVFEYAEHDSNFVPLMTLRSSHGLHYGKAENKFSVSLFVQR